MYMPSVHSEKVGEIVVAIDTSGSISGEAITEFATELVSICDVVNPDRVRVLWWDTQVHGEQIFEENYSGLTKMLKPMGGGGTRVSCVSEFLNNNSYAPDCVIVFTDGYLESDINWETDIPTLWMLTRRKDIKVKGQVVRMD
jgi:predicted metal-dependent peptidase